MQVVKEGIPVIHSSINIIEISTELTKLFKNLYQILESQTSNFDEEIEAFIAESRLNLPNLSMESFLKNINIISYKLRKNDERINPDLVKKIVLKIHELSNFESPELLTISRLMEILRLSISVTLPSFESTSANDLYTNYATIGNVIQVRGTINDKRYTRFQESHGGSSENVYFYLDGVGIFAEPAKTRIAQQENHPFGQPEIIDHHQDRDLNNASTVEMYLSNLLTLLRIGPENIEEFIHGLRKLLFDENFHSKESTNEKIELFKIKFYLNSLKIIDHLIDLFRDIHKHVYVMNVPDPDSVLPESIHSFIIFWDSLFTNSEFCKIPMDDQGVKIAFAQSYYKDFLTQSINIDPVEIYNTAVLNQFSDLNIETILLEHSNAENSTLIKAQLLEVIRVNHPQIGLPIDGDESISTHVDQPQIKLSNQELDSIVDVFEETLKSNCTKIGISHRIEKYDFESVSHETILSIFNRFFVYRLRTKQMFEAVEQAKLKKDAELDTFLNSKLFENTLEEIADIYIKSVQMADQRGNFDYICLYAVEIFLEKIETIIKCVSIADARGGIFPIVDHRLNLKLPENSSFNNIDQLVNLIKIQFIKSKVPHTSQLLSLALALVTDTIHTEALKLMSSFRRNDAIKSHTDFNLYSFTLLSMVLAFNDIDHFANVVESYHPVKQIRFDNSNFYKQFTSICRGVKVIFYKQSEAPKSLGGMDRTIVNMEQPDMIVVYVGQAGASGIYNYTFAIPRHEGADLMRDFLNFISFLTITNLGEPNIKDINIDQIHRFNLVPGSDYGITGTRTVGLEHPPNYMMELLDKFVRVYTFFKNKNGDRTHSFEVNETIFLNYLLETVNQSSVALLDQDFHDRQN